MALFIEPFGKRAREVQSLWLAIAALGGDRDSQIVDGDILFGFGGDGNLDEERSTVSDLVNKERVPMETYSLPTGRSANIDSSLLLQPYPQRQSRIEHGVHSDSTRSVVLGALEPQLVVPEEACRRDEEGAVAQAQTHIGQCVRLRELERVEVVRDRIVGGVL